MKNKIYTALLSIFTAFIIFNFTAAANTICTNMDWHAQPFDVLRYNLDAFIENPSNSYIVGKNTIDLKLMHESPTDNFFFHLIGLNIDSCLIKGVRVSPDSALDSLGTRYYKIPVGLYTEDTIHVEIYYSGTMQHESGDMDWGGIHFMDSVLFNMGAAFNMKNVSAGAYWMPCYDHPGDKAQYTFRFTVPKQYKVASGGELTVEEPADTAFTTYKWSSRYPAATYLMCFAIGRFDETVIDGMEDGLTNIIYTRPDKTEDAKVGLKNLPKMVKCLESYFGKYPFEKIGYVATAIGSMEHQSMISVARGSLDKQDTISANPFHELAHSWFGDMVTPRDMRSVWLNESFATYCESLWYYYEFGEEAYYTYLHSMVLRAQNLVKTEGAIPLYDFPRPDNVGNYPTTIYDKGGAVVQELRYYINNDSLFFGGLRNYLDKHKYGNVDNADFKADMEAYTGRDLTEFFNMWIYGVGYPLVDVNMEKIPYPDGKYSKCIFTVIQKQKETWGKYKDFPFEVNFKISSDNYWNAYFNIDSTFQVAEIDSVPEFTNVFYNKGKIQASLVKVDQSSVSFVEEFSSLNKMKLYPNPVSNGEITFELSGNSNSEITAAIFDINGKIVSSSDFGNTSGGQICTGGLPAGVYSLVITDSATGKLISESMFNVIGK